MTEANYEDIADVSREEDVVRGVLLGDALVGSACTVLRGIPVVIVPAMTEFRVHGREHL